MSSDPFTEPVVEPVIEAVRPAASDDELAAIVAAYEELWAGSVADGPEPDAVPAWRFSGRWWMASSGRKLLRPSPGRPSPRR